MNQQEFELIADCLRECLSVCIESPEPKRTKADTVKEVTKALATSMDQANYKAFDYDKFMGAAFYGYDDDGFPMCPNYGAKVLPNEANRCSLCNRHKAW